MNIKDTLPTAYIACPYAGQEESEVIAACIICAKSLLPNYHPYSPLLHGIAINESIDSTFRPTEDYWREHGVSMARRMDAMFVIGLPGWSKSKGVMSEISAWRETHNNGCVYLLTDYAWETQKGIEDTVASAAEAAEMQKAVRIQEANMSLCRTLGEQVMVNDALITDLEEALNLSLENRTNIERLNPHRPSGAHGQTMPNDYGDPTYYDEWLRRQTKTLRGLLNVWKWRGSGNPGNPGDTK